MEANPGTIDFELCQNFKQAGINRFSLGIQSFNDEKLKNIKRIHDAKEALDAITAVKKAGFANFNLDLIYGLPGQTVTDAIDDLKIALGFKPPHISWYQLTLEEIKPSFSATLLKLPCDEELWNIQQMGQEYLAEFGLKQYEVSAYCQAFDDKCKHNMNYWLYGDYMGIGAGAHGKITLDDHVVRRYTKISNPSKYLESENLFANEEVVAKKNIPFEFMLNALRLHQPINYDLFARRTGFTIDIIKKQLQSAENLGLVVLQKGAIITTDKGKNFLNDLLEIFI
jgi:putative oxygen-independent coproporphyrinogen III oxidase